MFVSIFMSFFFASALFVRQLSDFGQNNILLSTISKKLMLVILIFFVGMTKYCELDARFMIAALILLPLMLPFTRNLLEKVRIQRCHGQKLPFVRSIMLRMAAGESFRRALQASYASVHPSTRDIFKTIVENSLLRASEPTYREKFYDLEIVLYRARSQRQNVMLELKIYREKLEIESSFSKKVKSVTSQVRVQSLTVLFLYLLAFVFILNKYGLARFQAIYVSSVGLMIIGLAISVFLMRRFKWKV